MVVSNDPNRISRPTIEILPNHKVPNYQVLKLVVIAS